MLDLLTVNLRQFDEEEPETSEEPEQQEEDFSKYIGEGGELDVDSLINDYKETENEPEPEVNDHENEEGDPENDESDPEPEKEDESEEEKPVEKNTPEQAFAELRRKAEQYEPLANWVQELAAKQGFKDPQELIEAYQKQQIAKEAQQKGVPVEIYERLNQLESENKQKEEQMFRERFNNEVATVKEKYNLNDDQITEVFRFMGQNGYVDENGRSIIPFEDAYTLANRDTLIKDAEERGRQAYLEEKQKQQTQATPNAGTNAEDKKSEGEIDLSSENVFDTLEKMGIEWR